MDELLEAVKLLAAHGDKGAIIKLLKDHAGGIHQAVFQEGHNIGYGKKEGELTEANAKVTTLTSEKTQLAKDLEDARKANPDLAKIQETHAATIAQLQERHKAEMDEVTGKVNTMELGQGRAALAKALKDLGVDPDYADTVMVHRDDVVKRIEIEKGTGKHLFLQAGGSIPIVSGDGKAAAMILAEELVKGVDPKWIAAEGDRGAGRNTHGAPGDAASKVAKLVDEAQKEVKERREAAGGNKVGPGGVPEGLGHLATTGA
jgi:hypothetical protein